MSAFSRANARVSRMNLLFGDERFPNQVIPCCLDLPFCGTELLLIARVRAELRPSQFLALGVLQALEEKAFQF